MLCYVQVKPTHYGLYGWKYTTQHRKKHKQTLQRNENNDFARDIKSKQFFF